MYIFIKLLPVDLREKTCYGIHHWGSAERIYEQHKQNKTCDQIKTAATIFEESLRCATNQDRPLFVLCTDLWMNATPEVVPISNPNSKWIQLILNPN